MKIEWIWIIIWYLNINYYLKINELIEWLSEIENINVLEMNGLELNKLIWKLIISNFLRKLSMQMYDIYIEKFCNMFEKLTNLLFWKNNLSHYFFQISIEFQKVETSINFNHGCSRRTTRNPRLDGGSHWASRRKHDPGANRWGPRRVRYF